MHVYASVDFVFVNLSVTHNLKFSKYFVTSELQTIFCTQLIGIFVICVYTKLHIRGYKQ